MTPTRDPGNGDLDPESIAELRRRARSRPTSGRAAVAKASAIRTLQRLGRDRRRLVVPPMPEGSYPHEPGDPSYELDWLFLHAHPNVLQRHWGEVAGGASVTQRGSDSPLRFGTTPSCFARSRSALSHG